MGHLEAAAGISQLSKVLLQLQHKKFIPTLHAEPLNPLIDFADTAFYVQKSYADWTTPLGKKRIAGISSFGAGGANVHMIVEEYESSAENHAIPGPYVFILSAQNEERLHEYINIYKKFIEKNSNRDNQWLSALCYTLQIGRESFASRLAILCDNISDLSVKLNQLADNRCIWLKHKVSTSHKDFSSTDGVACVQQWIAGDRVDWNGIYNTTRPQIISLPNYPFAKRRCWVTEEVIEVERQPEIAKTISLTSEEVLHCVQSILATTLGMEFNEIDPEVPFLNYGLDSIIGINFVAELNTTFAILTPMDLYRYPAVYQLSEYLFTRCCSANNPEPTDLNSKHIFDEDKFVASISKLSDAEVAAILEAELKDLELI